MIYLAGLGAGFSRYGYFVIVLCYLGLPLRQLESKECHVKLLQVIQFQRQQFHVPFCQFGGFVIREAVSLYLFRREVVGYYAGDGFNPQLLGGFEPRVSADHHTSAVYDYRLLKTKLFYALRYRVHGLVVAARVIGVGDYLVDRF